MMRVTRLMRGNRKYAEKGIRSCGYTPPNACCKFLAQMAVVHKDSPTQSITLHTYALLYSRKPLCYESPPLRFPLSFRTSSPVRPGEISLIKCFILCNEGVLSSYFAINQQVKTILWVLRYSAFREFYTLNFKASSIR